MMNFSEEVFVSVSVEDLELINKVLRWALDDTEEREFLAQQRDAEAQSEDEKIFPEILEELHEDTVQARSACERAHDLLTSALAELAWR